MSAASVIICRSGYSSVMDLMKMKKRAILMPTPGQTEQLHLGLQMQKKGLCILQHQDAVYLKKGLLDCKNLPEIHVNMNFNRIEKALEDFGI
jgi:predicted glycosyltransferase